MKCTLHIENLLQTSIEKEVTDQGDYDYTNLSTDNI
jgi:hypothetical protein